MNTIRYRWCIQNPTKRSTFEQFNQWGYDSERNAIRNIDVDCDRRYRLYQYNFTSGKITIVPASKIDLNNPSDMSDRIELLVNTYGWKALSSKQHKQIMKFAIDEDLDFLDYIFDRIVDTSSTWDQFIFKNRKCERRIMCKYHKHLHNESHWINQTLKENYDDDYSTISWISDWKRKFGTFVPKDKPIVGYKAFRLMDNGTLQCRNYKFDLDKIHTRKFVWPCESGFHFCKVKRNINGYYTLTRSDVVVYKVHGWGIVINDGDKTVCSHLQIISKVRK